MNNSTAENQKFGQYNYTYLVLIKEDFPHRHRKFYALYFSSLSPVLIIEESYLQTFLHRLGFGMMRLPVTGGEPTNIDYETLNSMYSIFSNSPKSSDCFRGSHG